MVTASLKNYRQSPRKVRVVANLIKGKKADVAVAILAFTAKSAADPILKLLKSAIANAKNMSISETNLVVKSITVDKGPIMKRMMPRARGRGFPIHKHTSTVNVVLDTAAPKKAVKAEKGAVKAPVKATAKKTTK